MIKNALNRRMPAYFLVIILILAAAGIFIFMKYFQERIYNYRFEIPGANRISEPFNYGEWSALANADFYKSVRDKMISEKTNFIDADLSTMKMSVYTDGNKTAEFTILTKGKPGSWWETPAGLYKIQSKSKSVFSSFGKVYMPYSMQFQGNFFIHGWPYYPDGTPVASTYSGGCIRLSTDDAAKLFDLAKVGMPVLVFTDSFERDNFGYSLNMPQVSAKNYLAADIKNNFVFAEKDSGDVVPIASITKLITALVATDYINLDKTITIDDSMLIHTSKPRLQSGTSISAMNLLYPLLLESSNEAAMALADFLGQENFIKAMSDKAQALGMANSKFADAYGGADENVSSAEDLFNLAKYLYNSRSFVLKLSAGKLQNTAYGSQPFYNLQNFNLFNNDPEFVGGKIGKTAGAGETMLAVFNVDINGVERPIAIIVLGSQDNKIKDDVQNILNWIKTNYVSAQN